MANGALVMIDALGFRKIWVRHDPQIVMAKMQRLRKWCADEVGQCNAPGLGGLPGNIHQNVRKLMAISSELKDQILNQKIPVNPFGTTGNAKQLVDNIVKDSNSLFAVSNGMSHPNQWVTAKAILLSDTIVIAISSNKAPNDPRVTPGVLLSLAAGLTGRILTTAMQDEPRLSYRGCIAFGPFVVDDQFLVGEAVDEAAEHMDEPSAAIVALSPSAVAALEKTYWGALIPYDVPMKRRGATATFAVIPAGVNELGETEWHTQKELFLATFVGDSSVEIKRNNTEKFLDACRVASKERPSNPQPAE